MSDTPTPRTDAEHAQFPMGGFTLDFSRKLEHELTTVTEQRDEMKEQSEYWANLWADLARACVKDLAKVEREVVTLTEQRDRLAEAVNAATILIAAKGRHNTMLAYEGLREAIQSLTTNNDR